MNTQAMTTFKEKSRKVVIRGFRAGVAAITGICLLFGLSLSAYPQTKSQKPVQKEKTMKTQARGTFDVKVIPQVPDDNYQEAGIGRFLLDKQFHGDLEASSKGQMLASGSPADGSGGYVAMEKVSGTLNGRKGSFVLQHNGTMKGGAAEMNVAVVPGSGTDQLAGLDGKMTIIIADGKHSYEFEYTLAETH
ncbi:MAG: DUF3224 domain-containing protein [Acidobacteriota bacterium]